MTRHWAFEQVEWRRTSRAHRPRRRRGLGPRGCATSMIMRSGRADVAIMLASSAALVLALWVLPRVLAMLPYPLGAAADQFGHGARVTVELTALAGVSGLVLGAIVGLGRITPHGIPRALAGFYVWVIRGTPLVVQILFVYFVVPTIAPALSLSDFTSAVIALSMNVAAYNAEAMRASLQAVPRGQWEAAHILGLRRLQSLRFIIFPQAIRTAIPPLVNNAIGLLKDSSLAYTIGVVEISLVANRVQSETFRPVPIFLATAGIYLLMTSFLSIFSGALERWLQRGHR
jgi:polar amino acid transport system permease protein